jgi:hypothetical protein
MAGGLQAAPASGLKAEPAAIGGRRSAGRCHPGGRERVSFG